MVRSLANRTFQLRAELHAELARPPLVPLAVGAFGLRVLPGVRVAGRRVHVVVVAAEDVVPHLTNSDKLTRFGKLRRARSLLYRRQILQQNMLRWKALDEIFKIYMLLHRSDLNISEKFRQTSPHFPAKFRKIRSF